MQVFANGKRRFLSFIEFYGIHVKNQEVEIWSQWHGIVKGMSRQQNGTCEWEVLVIEWDLSIKFFLFHFQFHYDKAAPI